MNKALALKGVADLGRAREWLEDVLVKGAVDNVPADNNCLFNLYTRLGGIRASLNKISFVLLSLVEENTLEDSLQYSDFQSDTAKSELNAFIRKNSGKLDFGVSEYNLDHSIPEKIKTYPIEKIPNTRVELRKNAHLDLAYVTLFSLVELYRQRGDVLFDKNVRLSLSGNKEARERLVNPMTQTLELITSGKTGPSFFSFCHIGVTVAATASADEDDTVLKLEAPSIINGCQTITIANEYLKKLEKQKNPEALERFKQIKVVAKVVVGTSNDELKEITNCNNRQNPIENWQLFSNEPVHLEIEAALKDIGVFYERQKGKFDAVMKKADVAGRYLATKGTYIRVLDLGQVISLSRSQFQWAAKPSEIFVNKANHDAIFNRTMPRYARDAVFVVNVYKALKRGLNTFLARPPHINSSEIFKKQVLRVHIYHLGLLHFYQNKKCEWAREEFSQYLNKKAAPRLVDVVEAFYQKVIGRVRAWHNDVSKASSVEVSSKKMDSFFTTLAAEVGVDIEGAVPFSAKSINWKEIHGG